MNARQRAWRRTRSPSKVRARVIRGSCGTVFASIRWRMGSGFSDSLPGDHAPIPPWRARRRPGTSPLARTSRDSGGRRSRFDPLLALGGPVLQELSTRFPACLEMVPLAANVVSRRITPPLFGLGLVEAIVDADIQVREAFSPPGVSGRANLVTPVETPSGQPRVRRFGWKSQIATVLTFSGEALLNELGITNRWFPLDNVPNGAPGTSHPCTDLVPDPRTFRTHSVFSSSIASPISCTCSRRRPRRPSRGCRGPARCRLVFSNGNGQRVKQPPPARPARRAESVRRERTAIFVQANRRAQHARDSTLLERVSPCRASPCRLSPCRVPSCRVPSCRVPPCRASSCRASSCRVPLCRVPLCRVPSCPVPPCRVPSLFEPASYRHCRPRRAR